MRNARLDESQAEMKTARRNISNLRLQMIPLQWQKEKRNLMRVKEENEKTDLKLYIQKIKIMAPGPIASWQIDGRKVETVTDFLFWGSKISADHDCSHEVKRHLSLGRNTMTNLDSMFKSRDITLPTKVNIVKAIVFPGIMDRCESWIIKKAECQRTDAVKLLKKHPESPLDSKETKSVHPKGKQP